jgi:hypothetical protein
MLVYGIAVMESGNFALSLCRVLEKKGLYFEIVATPCRIATGGCGYSIKFPLENTDMLVDEAASQRIRIEALYKVVPGLTKNYYERM